MKYQFGGRNSKWRTLEVGQMASPTFSNGEMMVSVKKKGAEAKKVGGGKILGFWSKIHIVWSNANLCDRY